MDWQALISVGINIVGIIVALGIFLYAWRHRAVPGAKYFGLYMLAAAEWALSIVFWILVGDVVQVGSLTLEGVWPLIGQVGILVMPAVWLAFALKYTGRDKWLKVHFWGPLAAVLLVVFLLQLAHEAGVWVRVSHDLSYWGGSMRFLAPMGMAMFGVALEGLYVSVLLLFGGLLLVLDLVQSPRIYRGQYLTLLIGGLAPWMFGVPAILGIGPFFEEWVSLSFAIGGLIGVWGIARFRLFDVVPIALGAVVESLDDGVIVLDTQNRIVHLNPAAQGMIGRPRRELEEEPVAKALSGWTDLLHSLDRGQVQTEITGGQDPERRHYDLRISPLYGRRNLLSGRLIRLHDITQRKQREAELRRINAEHARRNRELALLNRVIAAATSRLEPQAVLEAVCRELAWAFDSPRVAVALANQDRTALTVVAEHRAEGYPSSLDLAIPVENNPATLHVLEHKAPLAVLDAQHDPRMAPVHDLMRQQGVASLLILPLIVRDQAVGTIGLDAVEPREFSEAEIALAASVAAAASQALENAQAEEALRQSEARYRLLVENAPVGILSANRDGQVVDVNPQLLLILGSPSAEATRDINVLTYPPLVEAGVAAVARRCLAGVSLTSEFPYTSARGKRVYLRLHATPIHDADQQIAGLQAIVEDITERKQVEEELRASEERLKLAIEGAGLGLWDIDLATGDTFINSPGALYLGFAPGERVPEQEVDTRLKEYVHPEDRDKLDQALNLHLADEVPFWEAEVRTPKPEKPGEWDWILLRGQVVARDGQGQPLRMAGITQDITRRKRAEEAMRESEERLKIAMEAADLALWDMNLVTNETVVAHAKGDQDGWGYDSEVMTDELWAEWIHPEDLPRVFAAMDRHMAGETPVYEVEFRARYGKDDWIWFLQRGKVVAWDEKGRPLRGTGIQEDITARKQVEEELRQAKDAAEAANRAKSVFLANMSHELRTPLNAILGFSELMGRDPVLTAEQRDHLETIGRSGRHLLTLINDILEMSKIEAGRTMFYEHGFDLHHLLADLASMFRLRAARKGLQLLVECAEDVPQYVRTDEGKLRQVLINLLSNAVKFTAEGQVTLRVKAPAPGLEPGMRDLEFEVEDTGPGISPEDIERIFDPFVQTASGIQSQEGTGLGLPISRQFVDMLDGELTVNSELGKGSVFKFTARVGVADAAEVQAERSARRVVGVEPGQPVYRLLIAEDRDTNRELLAKLLRPLGFEVREAINGQEAVEIWEEWSPHLIWMDMRMPVMDGYEATRRIKATTKGQATVIIALTASAFEEDRAAILSEGCDDFVRKPFREAEIFEKLAQHLGVRFIYEEQAPPPRARPVDMEGLLTPETLAALPAEWVTELHQAAAQADADLVLDLVEEVRAQHGPLAEALTTLVQNFRFDTIMDLTWVNQSQPE